MALDLSSLQASALARAPKLLRAGGELSAKPVYSKVRFAVQLGTALAALEHTSVHSEAHGDLRAFDYRRGAVASAGGFGASTTASIRHTNVTTEGEIPNGGDALIVGFHLRAHAMRKPQTTNSVDGILNDSNNTSKPMRDALADSGAVSSLQAMILELISDCYVPYVQRAGKQREYLTPIKWSRDGRSGFEALFSDPIGWVVGSGEKFAFGFERKGAVTWSAKASDPLFWAVVETAVDGAIADNTVAAVLQDVTVSTVGARFDPKASA